jgi:hypothetical protein
MAHIRKDLSFIFIVITSFFRSIDHYLICAMELFLKEVKTASTNKWKMLSASHAII